MDINVASAAVETFVQDYAGPGGRKAVELRIHPSGDDMNAIKVWVNLGPDAENDDLHAWCRACEAAVREALGGDLDGYHLEMRADAM
ncbi:MAG: hypothetical protein KC464_00435 [Myxococcales bacterium]|nr:hypothetical protein [Myxococcales bacterium]